MLSGGCEGVLYETREKYLTLDHLPGSALEISTANGSVEVWPGSEPAILVRAVIRARVGRGDQVGVRAVHEPGGTIVLTPEWPGGGRRGSEGCSFAVTTPTLAGVKVRTSNGRVEVAGMAGHADLAGSNGRIILADHAGDARLKTSNGSIRATAVAGSIEAETSNGSISINGVGGPVTARTTNGALSFTLGEGFQGPVKACSSNGSITLRLGRGVPGEFEVSSSNGGVRVLGAAAERVVVRRWSAAVTMGLGPKSVLSSSNGSIRIELPDALTEPAASLPGPRQALPVTPVDAPLIGSGVITPPR
jgi:hypothetical protein